MWKGSKSMKSIKEMIEVMQAYESGERIQVKNIADNTTPNGVLFPNNATAIPSNPCDGITPICII